MQLLEANPMTPRPTAESPTLNKAARALLDAFKPREGVPTDLIVHANIKARLLEVQAEAATLSDPLRDWLDEHDDQHRALREAAEGLLDAMYSDDVGVKVSARERLRSALLAQPTPDAKPSLDAITAWLQSPEAESRLTAALKATEDDWTSNEYVEDSARAILAALTKP